jgi:hypothetical protein
MQISALANDTLTNRYGVRTLAYDFYQPNDTSVSVRPFFTKYAAMNPDMFFGTLLLLVHCVSTAAHCLSAGGGYEVDGTLLVNSYVYNSAVQFTPKLVLMYIAASTPSFLRNGWKVSELFLGGELMSLQGAYVASNTAWSSSYPFYDDFFANATDTGSVRYRDLFKRLLNAEPAYQSAFATVGGIVVMVREIAFVCSQVVTSHSPSLQKALEAAQTFEPNALRAAMKSLNISTILGQLSFQANGAPTIPSTACVQVQYTDPSNSDSDLEQRVVSPAPFTAPNISLQFGMVAMPPSSLVTFSRVNTSSATSIGLIALASLGLLATLVVLCFLLRHRNSPIVVASSWHFIGTHLLGVAIAYASVISFAVSVSDVSCIFQTVLSLLAISLVLGYVLLLGPLSDLLTHSPRPVVAKMLRARRMLSNTTMMVMPMGRKEFFGYLGVLLGIQVVSCSSTSVVDLQCFSSSLKFHLLFTQCAAFCCPYVLAALQVILVIWGSGFALRRTRVLTSVDYAYIVVCAGPQDWVFLGLELGVVVRLSALTFQL